MSYQQSWQQFSTIGFALIMGTIGTALASPLYPLYQQAWHLLPSHITYIFVAYMFGCLATLLFLGRLSNSIGFLTTLKMGVGLVITGLILSAMANTPIQLGAGRFVIGIASGLITTSAMLGLITSIPNSHRALAPQISSIVTAIGFGLGPFVGGLIAQFSVLPLVTPYIVVIVGAMLSLLLLYFVKKPAFEPQPLSLVPKLQAPDAPHKMGFYVVGLTAFCAFAAFCLFASLSPSFVQDILPWHGPLVSGTAIALILLVSAMTQFFARQVAMKTALSWGLIGLILSVFVLGLCMYLQWSVLFFLSTLLVGIGHGLALLGAFGFVHHMSHEHNRAAVMSTYLFVGYLGTIVPIIAVGYLADHMGLNAAIVWFCVGIGILCLLLWFWHKKALK